MKLQQSTYARHLVLAFFLILVLGCTSVASAQKKAATRELGGVDLTGMVVFNRQFDQIFQVDAQTNLSVSHKFGGAIRISTWDNPIVSLQAIIKVGAKNMSLAEHFAQSIMIEAVKEGNQINLESIFPDVQASAAIGGYEVELFITVPSKISVTAQNVFGDCYVNGISGDVIVDVSFGGIYLSDLSGKVNVRAKGEYPLEAKNINNGGIFFLRGTKAKLSDINGQIILNNYLGSVELDKLGDAVDISASCNNGPIELVLAENPNSYIFATADFGEITTGLPLQRQLLGRTHIAHTGSKDSSQRIELNTTFGDITIKTQSSKPIIETAVIEDAKPFKQSESTTISVAPERQLHIDSIGGEIILEGVENSETIHLEVERVVRVQDIKKAEDALEALRWMREEKDKTIHLKTYTEGDLVGLGIKDYQVNLTIQYPMSMPIEINNADGETVVQRAEAPVTISQQKGTILMLNATAGGILTNHSGDIDIHGGNGDIKAHTVGGTIRAKQVEGDLHLESNSGKITIDTPRSSVFARNTGGDIRIIALEGVLGDFDIKTTNGDISMLIPPTSDALLVLNVKDGNIYSSFPLTGSVQKTTSTFQGRLNQATHRVVLETEDGDIKLD